jgi:hypothetical protein
MGAADFSGYATKAGLKCSDGRTIAPDAFKHMDGMKVPLLWEHGHNSPENVLGHAILKHVADGMRVFGYFNKSKQGQSAKEFVDHRDIEALSIYANQLVEKSKNVLHGMIREVSLVLSGANPGALIDFVAVQHSDGEITNLEDEAIIHTGLGIMHGDSAGDPDSADETTDGKEEVVSDSSADAVQHSADDPTVEEVWNGFSAVQKNVVSFMIGAALDNAGGTTQHSDTTDDEGDLKHHQEGNADMSGRNVFDQTDTDADKKDKRHYISHADKEAILATAKKPGETLKSAVEAYALQHNIDNIDLLFPDARSVMDRPEWDKRRTEWVQGVLDNTNHTPFSRIKSLSADLTLEDARAKGYIKGNLKKEQFFALTKRTTGPATIYKKQKLDRDDIVDITDFDVVAWLKIEMRFMLEEEPRPRRARWRRSRCRQR